MKVIKHIISIILSISFLKEYNYNEEQKLKLRRQFKYLVAIWILFILPFVFPLPSIFGDRPEHIRSLITFVFFLVFTVYHWFLLIYISRFAKKNIAYLLLLLPMSYFLVENLILWNKPTYNGAMDGFASMATIVQQVNIIVIWPTFTFALLMVNLKNHLKGILLFLITLTSAVIGIRQCIGKEGYLADASGGVFAWLVIMLLLMSAHLIWFAKNKKLNRL